MMHRPHNASVKLANIEQKDELRYNLMSKREIIYKSSVGSGETKARRQRQGTKGKEPKAEETKAGNQIFRNGLPSELREQFSLPRRFRKHRGSV